MTRASTTERRRYSIRAHLSIQRIAKGHGYVNVSLHYDNTAMEITLEFAKRNDCQRACASLRSVKQHAIAPLAR